MTDRNAFRLLLNGPNHFTPHLSLNPHHLARLHSQNPRYTPSMHRFLTKIIAILLCASFISKADEAAVLADPAAAEAWLKQNPNAVVLDVRTKQEHAQGALQGALLIPFTDKDFSERVRKELKPDQPVLVYCRSGGRSADAVKIMKSAGFQNLRELDGGILAWIKAGKPVKK